MANARRRIARSLLFRARHYKHVLSLETCDLSKFWKQAFRPSARKSNATQSRPHLHLQLRLVATCPSFRPYTNLTQSYSPSMLPPSPIRLSQQQLFDDYGKGMVTFHHNAGPAIYSFFIGLYLASNTGRAEKTILVLARPEAMSVSVVDVFCEDDSSED